MIFTLNERGFPLGEGVNEATAPVGKIAMDERIKPMSSKNGALVRGLNRMRKAMARDASPDDKPMDKIVDFIRKRFSASDDDVQDLMTALGVGPEDAPQVAADRAMRLRTGARLPSHGHHPGFAERFPDAMKIRTY
jgi:hypothetical protein